MKRYLILITVVMNTFASFGQTIDDSSVTEAGLAYNQSVNKKATKFATQLVNTNNFKKLKGIYYEFNLPISGIKVNNLRYATRQWYLKFKKLSSLSDLGTTFDENGTFSFDESYSVPNTYQYGTNVSSSAYSRIYFDLNICDSVVNIVVYCPLYTMHYKSKKLSDVVKGNDSDFIEFFPLKVYPFKSSNMDETFAVIYANTSARCIMLVQDWLDFVKSKYIHEENDDIINDSKNYRDNVNVETKSNDIDIELNNDGSFSKVITTELTEKDEYKYIRSYLAKTIKDYKNKVQVEDDNTGEIICELSLPLNSSHIFNDEPYGFDGIYKVRLIVECKDNRFRIKGEEVICEGKMHRLGGNYAKNTITGTFDGSEESMKKDFKSKIIKFISEMMDSIAKQKEDSF